MIRTANANLEALRHAQPFNLKYRCYLVHSSDQCGGFGTSSTSSGLSGRRLKQLEQRFSPFPTERPKRLRPLPSFIAFESSCGAVTAIWKDLVFPSGPGEGACGRYDALDCRIVDAESGRRGGGEGEMVGVFPGELRRFQWMLGLGERGRPSGERGVRRK